MIPCFIQMMKTKSCILFPLYHQKNLRMNIPCFIRANIDEDTEMYTISISSKASYNLELGGLSVYHIQKAFFFKPL